MTKKQAEWLRSQIGNFPTIENLMTNTYKLLMEVTDVESEDGWGDICSYEELEVGKLYSIFDGSQFTTAMTYIPAESTELFFTNKDGGYIKCKSVKLINIKKLNYDNNNNN